MIQRLSLFFTKHRFDLGITFLVTLVTLFIYLYRLTEITPGMWGDELGTGIMAEQLQNQGKFTPFLPYNYGHPTLLPYLSLFFISMLGKSVVSLRIVSILFGALSVGMLYIALRQHYSRSLSVAGSALLATQYVFVVVSRFAYEMSAAVFFTILSFIFFFCFLNKKSPWLLAFLGISLGLGLYTYLPFRVICFVFLGASLGIISTLKKGKLFHIGVLFGSFLIVTLPLFVYSFSHWQEINARTIALSVFHQNLPSTEVAMELLGAGLRTLSMFFFVGDPNPRQNPAGTTPFDFLTTGLFFTGLIFLWVRNRRAAMLMSVFVAAILGTEIVTIERIPEFHYYGLGHPNTLRISPLVPLVVFGAIQGIKEVQDRIIYPKHKRAFLFIVVGVISILNLYRYFGQKPNPWIYTTNFVPILNIISFLNTTDSLREVGVSQSIYESQHVNYLLRPGITLANIPAPLDCSFPGFGQQLVVLFIDDLVNCRDEDMQTLFANKRLVIKEMRSPWDTLDALIIYSSGDTLLSN